MSRERWRRVAKWFEAALRRPAAARRTWLAEECPDADVRAEVEAMLDAHEGADGILDRSLGSLAPRALDSEPTAVEDAGPYRVVREIGRGGMGVVYQAHDPRLDRFVALKFLPPAFDADDEIQARFLTEAKAASTLDHPNICTIYDIGRSAAGRLYIAMAFYEGETLAVRLERGALEIDEAVDVLQQVAQGVARAHEAGIVHRDIKPSNLMLTPRGVVKILDFGVAKLEGGATLTQPGMLVGTPAYMSPEQLGGEEVDQRTDVWSLGVVLYEMLAGRRPFHGDRRTILTAILQREPEPVEMVRPETPEWLAELVRRLLVKSPAHRVEGGGELLAEIGRMRRGTLPPSPVPQRFVPRPRPLPQNLTSFVDRDEEVELVARLLSEARIVTLTGPAGTGKTRLALRVAERMSEAYADGIVFVPLTTVIDASLVIPAVAEALGAPESPSGRTLERLQGILADRELLLILDDFEQVVEAASDVGRLLGACSSLKVLVTSRLPLRLSGEHEFPVRPLAVPDRRRPANLEEALDFPAIQLFRDRARATDPTFRLRADNVNAVAELCARLDGLPLAIELAAVRVKLFSPSELLSRLGARLDLLKGGPRDRPARHQTLRGAIDWSYRLLSDDERKLFRTLAVFVGGCTLDAARRIVEAQSEIAVDILDGIASLVDQNLLRREESPGGETRFGMLETLRDYGLETLEQAGESVSVHRAHAAYYLELAEAAEPELTAARQAAWLDRLDAEHDNLRAAFASAVERGEPETALRLAAALWRFWLARGHLQEASQCIERALSLPAGRASSDAARARALNGLGTVAHNRGENEYARGRLEESLALWRQIGDERGVAAVLNNLGWVACELTDLEAAHELSDEGLALNRKLAETRGIAVALNNLGWVAHYVGDSRTARARHAESLELRRQIADQRGIVFALVNLAWAEQYHGSYDRTFALLDEAAEVVKPLGDRLLDGFVSLIRVIAWYDMGRFEEAVTAVERSWESWQEAGNRSGVAWSLSVHGALVLELGETARAERLLNEALALWRAIGGRWGMGLTQRNLARAALVSGRVDEARSGYQRSLELAHSLGLRLSVAECLEGLAPIHVAGGELERAARLLAAADAERTRLEVPVPPRLTRVLTALRERIRIKLGEEGTQLDSSAGDESSLAEVVAAELDSD